MSWLVLLLVILALVVAFGLILRVLEGAAKTIVAVIVLGIVVGGAVWIFWDINDLRQHFYQDEKLFILDIDGKAAGAFSLGSDGVPNIVTDLRTIRSAYPDVMLVRGNYYKVIVLTWPVVAQDLELSGFSATQDEIKTALLSENPTQLFIDKMVARYGQGAYGQVKLQADTLYPTHDAFASTVFALLASKPLSSPNLIFMGMNQGTVLILPETITIKILKILPSGMTNYLAPQPTP